MWPIQWSGFGNQRLIITSTLISAIHSALGGDNCTAVGLGTGASYDLTLTPNPSLSVTLTLHRRNPTVAGLWLQEAPPACTKQRIDLGPITSAGFLSKDVEILDNIFSAWVELKEGILSPT